MTLPRRLFVVSDVPGAEIGMRAIVEEDGTTVCNPSPMGEEVARLLAAAPNLLVALVDCQLFIEKRFGYMNQKAQQARAAIALATALDPITSYYRDRAASGQASLTAHR